MFRHVLAHSIKFRSFLRFTDFEGNFIQFLSAAVNLFTDFFRPLISADGNRINNSLPCYGRVNIPLMQSIIRNLG